GCPMGNCTDTVRYYFDTLAHTWMLERPDGIHSLDGTRTTVPVAPANVSNNTMGGLHMFHGGTHGSEDTIIPLSAQNFLILSRNYTTSSAYYQDPIAKTIVATDSTVAPRASTNEQIATIQAEAKAYGVQWQTISAPISVVGSVFNSVRIKDSATFLFTDNNNKIWTVNYQNTSFSEYSGTEAVVHGTDGLLSTVFQDWLKIQKHVGDPPDQSGAPGSITITGMLNVDGVLIASSIKVTGQ
ncbi:MAG: hypothetical protein Q7S34_04480, partial [bacterium]|nr:hypothetical protein [bacterium]